MAVSAYQLRMRTFDQKIKPIDMVWFFIWV
nr:MAG TPA_asm: hypothetical protein [Caudoviricetes sp.]